MIDFSERFTDEICVDITLLNIFVIDDDWYHITVITTYRPLSSKMKRNRKIPAGDNFVIRLTTDYLRTKEGE